MSEAIFLAVAQSYLRGSQITVRGMFKNSRQVVNISKWEKYNLEDFKKTIEKIRHWCRFTFNVFLKKTLIYSWCLLPSITKKIISYSLIPGEQPFITPQIQNFQESISIYLEIIRNLFNSKLYQKLCQKMPKNTNQAKKPGQIWSDNRLIEKYETISIKVKIHISQLIAKTLLKQRSLNQIRHCLAGHHFWHHFLIKK